MIDPYKILYSYNRGPIKSIKSMKDSPQKEKFATQLDSKLLKDLRHLARIEGRQIQSLTEEAILLLLDHHIHKKERLSVIDAYQTSHERFEKLYMNLAK